MKDNKLYIVMVGLPARGKSITATKLKENLKHDSIRAKVFNNGDLRRKMIPQNTSYAGFYDPKNKEGVALREKIALINIDKAQAYLERNGDVAIFHARVWPSQSRRSPGEFRGANFLLRVNLSFFGHRKKFRETGLTPHSNTRGRDRV
jgi:hypothetical protein